MYYQLPTASLPPYTRVSLRSLIGTLVSSFLTAAQHNETFILNEIAEEIEVDVDQVKAAEVMKDILRTVVGNSRYGDIHIYAERHREMITLNVQERNNYNGYALAFSIGTLRRDALSAGGDISIRDQQQKVTTISFCFPRRAA